MNWDVVYSGFQLGIEISFIALGLAWVLSVLKFLNFAHGDLISLGAYLTYAVRGASGWSFGVCAGISAILTGCVGVLIERFAFRPLRSRRLSMFLSSLGVSLILNAGLSLWFGSTARVYDYAPKSAIRLGSLAITGPDMAILFMLVAVLAASWWVLRRSLFGIALRAVSDNPTGVALLGISSDGLIAGTFFISSALAALSGTFLGLTGSLQPNMGFRYAVWAFAVVVLAGFGSVLGIIVTGTITGIIIAVTIAHWHTYDYVNVVLFSLMSAMLFLKPQGIFGLRMRRS